MGTRAMRLLGLVVVCTGLSCSIIVDTDGIDSGCGDRKKLCGGTCVSVGDPSYGCSSQPETSTKSNVRHGIRATGARR